MLQFLYIKPHWYLRALIYNCTYNSHMKDMFVFTTLFHNKKYFEERYSVSIHRILAYCVHIIDDSLQSSDQMRAIQSPIVKKFLTKDGFL